ncbi:MAG: helix-turn-helix domain-containing protein [Sediminibacterium sp.]|nr:helix-turn-helix domain-containing protein [Sediminibacterium sp.]MDP3128128.1 helix-turn-helix domain-containing protein [Sediminibacterium sp.]
MNPNIKANLPFINHVISNAQDDIKAQTGIQVVLYIRPHHMMLEDLINQLFLNVISNWEDVSLDDIKSDNRKTDIVTMRKILCMIAKYKFPKKDYPKAGLKTIGEVIGIGDHASVIHHINTGLDLLSIQDEKFMKYYNPVKDFFL